MDVLEVSQFNLDLCILNSWEEKKSVKLRTGAQDTATTRKEQGPVCNE